MARIKNYLKFLAVQTVELVVLYFIYSYCMLSYCMLVVFTVLNRIILRTQDMSKCKTGTKLRSISALIQSPYRTGFDNDFVIQPKYCQFI